MKRITNFTRPANRRVWPVVSTIWLVAGGVAAGSVAMLFWASELRKDSNRLESHITSLGEGISNLENQNTNVPSAQSLHELNTEAAFFNGLTGERRAPLLRVLDDLEILIPENVWVSQLDYDLDTGRFDLSLQAEQETQLPPALSRIESSELLESVILERQVRLQQGQRILVQYDIEAVVK